VTLNTGWKQCAQGQGACLEEKDAIVFVEVNLWIGPQALQQRRLVHHSLHKRAILGRWRRLSRAKPVLAEQHAHGHRLRGAAARHCCKTGAASALGFDEWANSIRFPQSVHGINADAENKRAGRRRIRAVRGFCDS
jgi:hypothetical protein